MLEASPSYVLLPNCQFIRDQFKFDYRFTYLVFASACLLAFWWSQNILPETSGVSLEEMGKLFGENSDTSILRRAEVRSTSR